MKVLMINASPRPNGNTNIALEEMRKVFEDAGVETTMVHIGNKDIRGCIACNSCAKNGKCIFDDMVNEVAPFFEEADGLVIGSPVYYANANGTLHSFMQRLFYSTPFDKTMKCGAAITVARRGGCTAAFDGMNKYFSICGMPIATSSYWNLAYGRLAGESREDGEGMETMRTLAKNMIFLMKSIQLGKEQFGLPEKEEHTVTNFIR